MQQLLVLTALCVVYASAGSPPECRYGPTYWCQNVRTAKSCGAVTHCIGTVWKTQAPPKTENSQETLCELCKKIMTDVRDLMTGNETQEQVKEFLEGACQMLPKPEYVTQCTEAVDDFAEEIFQMLKAQLNPDVLCAAFGMCASYKSPLIHETLLTESSEITNSVDTDTCALCKKYIGDVRNFVTGPTAEQDFRNYTIKYFCNFMGPFKEQCIQMVTEFTPEIMDLVKTEMDPTKICTMLGLCSGASDRTLEKMRASRLARTKKIQMSKMLKEDASVCDVCKKIMTEAKAIMTSAKTMQEWEDYLKKDLCRFLGPFKNECLSIVMDFTPEIIKLMKSKMDPSSICQAMGLCRGNRNILIVMKMQSSMLAQKLQGHVAQDEYCTTCKEVIQDVATFVQSNKQIVKNYIKTQLCSEMGSFAEMCNQTIDQYGDILFELLLNELNPEQVCSAIGVCSAGKSFTGGPLHLLSAVQPNKKPRVSSEVCVICEFVLQQLDNVLKDNATEEDIVTAVKNVCSLLPTTVSKSCNSFVDLYGPQVIQLLLKQLKPAQICSEIGLCNNTMIVHNVQSSDMCTECKIFLSYLVSLFNENATVQEIEKGLRQLCNSLPQADQNQCDKFVAEYTPQVIQILKNMISPEEVCKAVELCTTSALRQQLLVPAKKIVMGDKGCKQGPSFWCASMTNAKKCNAVSHCSKLLWKK
ncbi:prosaposin [Lingula anatina]|uniref:Prosaposin n=1 Tax=Lingula anatina TaxID=7574 RepID=A0A1S3H9P4_LINAN|nr:prosaposin [Lingula anatina]|eukprot:XP_013381849.1 prosaposin [Lingula anatina]